MIKTVDTATGHVEVVDLTGESDNSNNSVIEILGAVTQTDTGNNNNQQRMLVTDKDRAKEKRKRWLQRIGIFIRERALLLGPHDDSTRLRVAQLEWTKEERRAQIHGNASASNTTPSTIVLCNKDTMLFNSTISDRGWGCGYRNCQMLLSSLISEFNQASDDASDEVSGGNVTGAANRFPRDKVPSIHALQEMLELAWRDGYDKDGAEQLKHRVTGTRKWIGPTEVYCILAHIGVQANIVDFHCRTARDGTHPALFSWVVDYFTENAGQMETPAPLESNAGSVAQSKSTRFVAKHPLYLQHQGHSRTIVGVELTDTATNLLVFNPDINIDVDLSGAVRLSRFRLPLHETRRTPQFQILYVDNDLASSGNVEISRFISSTRVP